MPSLKYDSNPQWRHSASPGSKLPPPRSSSSPARVSSSSTSSSSWRRAAPAKNQSEHPSQLTRDWRASRPQSTPPPSSLSAPCRSHQINKPFEEEPFDIRLRCNKPSFFSDADKRADWNEQWNFALERITRKGHPMPHGYRAEEAQILCWWHSSPEDPIEHLQISYIYDKTMPVCRVEEGGGCYIKLHVYRTDEDELRADRQKAERAEERRRSI